MSSVDFSLWPQLASNKVEVCKLELCVVLLNDDSTYPWVVLVPQQNDLREMHDLSEPHQLLLMKEINLCSKKLQELYKPDKMNVAAIGCVCPQLHIHVLGRTEGDRAWPGPVWGAHPATPYDEETKAKRVEEIKKALLG